MNTVFCRIIDWNEYTTKYLRSADVKKTRLTGSLLLASYLPDVRRSFPFQLVFFIHFYACLSQ